MHRLTVGLTLVATLILAGCRVAPIYNPSDVAFTVSQTDAQKVLTLDDYRDAIVRGGSKRGWIFNDAGSGHLIGDLAVRSRHFVTVDIFFDTESYSILYKTSTNLNYNAERGEIHPNYNNWVEVLQNEIQAEIAQMKAG